MSGGFDQGVFDSARFDEEIYPTKSLILAAPFSRETAWMPYVAIAGSDETPTGFLIDELHRKLGVVTVIRNTYFVRATFGQDEPTDNDLIIKSVGIYSTVIGGVLGEYWILDSFVDKDNIDELVIECAVTIVHED